MTRAQIAASAVGLCGAGVLAFVALSMWISRSKPDPRLPRREGKAWTIRFPERVPSVGLRWSQARYPEQYPPSQRVSVELSGLDDSGKERFLDVGGQAYSREFIAGFSYTDPAVKRPAVRLEYLPRAETFVGKLIGEGLKPNFAYQVKLRGRFEDRPAFERIGHLGRWRLPTGGTNFLDAVYEAFPAKELVESYLLFDFFVTDPEGRVEKPLYADSTLHVLFNLDYQRIPSMSDARPVECSREGSNRLLYANPRADLSPQRVFAESEEHALAPHNRPPINEAFLPAGRYSAELVLTEESFHGFGENGSWATVLLAPVEFEVIAQPRPPPYWKALAPEGTPLSLARASINGLQKEVCTDAVLVGRAVNDHPSLVFSEEFADKPGERYVLALEMRVAGRHTWMVFVNQGTAYEEKPSYYVQTEGTGGWQRYEVEITSKSHGNIRMVPTLSPGPFGIRNVGIFRIAE